MPIFQSEITLWELGFRWTGRDPDGIWIRLPLDVRDHFRNVMGAILDGQLPCVTLSLEKWRSESGGDPQFHIRHYIDDVYLCLEGRGFQRKLLKWALIDRRDFHVWCTRRGIELPSFWFPNASKVEFDWDDLYRENEHIARLRYLNKQRFELSQKGEDTAAIEAELDALESPTAAKSAPSDASPKPENTSGVAPVIPLEQESQNSEQHKKSTRTKIASQEVASHLWTQFPDLRISEMVKRDEILKLCGADHYLPETIRGWMAEVAPPEVKAKRGRPRKK